MVSLFLADRLAGSLSASIPAHAPSLEHYAEKGRRSRINELERLRDLVPHEENASTSVILELTYQYIVDLRSRVAQLEEAVKAPPQLITLAGSYGRTQLSISQAAQAACNW